MQTAYLRLSFAPNGDEEKENHRKPAAAPRGNMQARSFQTATMSLLIFWCLLLGGFGRSLHQFRSWRRMSAVAVMNRVLLSCPQ
jgi:hypothetical protein